MSAASLELHEALARDGLDTGFERRGVLKVYETEAGLDAARHEAAALERQGIGCRVLDRSEVREVEPAVSGMIAGAVFSPDDARVDPQRFVEALARRASGEGAEVRTGVEVVRLRRLGDRIQVLETTDGDLAAGWVVVAAGVWSPLLLRGTGVACPVLGGKGYHVEMAAGPGDPSVPVMLMESRVIATSMPGRLRLAGTFELSGLDASIDQGRLATLQRAAERALPALRDRRVVHVWRGLRPCAPDGLPMVGRVPPVENLVLATAHATVGITLAPLTGRLVAEVITGSPPSCDMAPLDPARFSTRLARRLVFDAFAARTPR
jgi:D-amino-acid dehydrogenase